jgi:hypothetical protein
MKHTTLIAISLFVAPTLFGTSNWGSSGTSGKNDKQQINFYGSLKTHQGQTDTVNHILIEGKHNDIVMYDAPVKHAEEKFNPRTKQTEIRLDGNPGTDFVKSKIDLDQVSTIRVPKPSTAWVYQKEKKHQRQEFLLVHVTAKESNTPKEYLLEMKSRISCNSIDKNESQKKEVPLAAIDTLTVEGYSFTVSTDKKNVKKETPEKCPVVKTETETTTEVVVK